MENTIKNARMQQELLQELKRSYKRLNIGIPKEYIKGERRLMLTPEAVEILTNCGHRIIFESGAGLGINYGDNYYADAGAEIVTTPLEVYQSSDFILKVLPPLLDEIIMMRPRTILFSMVQFNYFSSVAYEMLISKKITAISYELISDERGFSPIMTSLSEIEGATAITIASDLLSNQHGGKGIIFGGVAGVSPVEVVIIGAGNAGTVAARTSLALGASVKVFDNDIQKLRLIRERLGQSLFTSTFHPKVLKNVFQSADVVIGANNYINVSDNYVIGESLIQSMKHGSVIIDLRVNQGGCFETTCSINPDKTPFFERFGVFHYCKPNISNLVARTASISLSNLILPRLLSIKEMGNFVGVIKSDQELKKGIYLYNGKPVDQYVSKHFDVHSNNIDIYLVAF